ncbi:MAG: uracil-DNA glycosylase [Gammaproteobacteria bacterium]|nr:uracil-DNA glycosylase [Gammaproteobacteria bacterium]
MSERDAYDPGCVSCPRLVAHLDGVRSMHPDYHARPVAPFGATDPGLLIVGLAPGMHGANATGRPFTGDYAGILLYQTLHKFGFSNLPVSEHRGDGLRLHGCRITNAVKCLPPENKPTPAEISQCNPFLRAELRDLRPDAVILALGTIAHQAVLRALSLPVREYKFSHGAEYSLPDGRRLFDSYHCSRYNTQTRRLTEAMFHAVFARIVGYCGTTPGATRLR